MQVGDLIELECSLVGDPAIWTVRGADVEGDHSAHAEEHAPGSGAQSGKVEARGTITEAFAQSSDIVTVTPDGGGPDVSCAIVPGSLSRFAAGDAVTLECVTVNSTLTLKEIEKAEGQRGSHDEGGGGDDHAHDDSGDDHGGGGDE